MSAADREEGEGGLGGADGKRGGEGRGGRITREVQQQARQRESPVVSELLVAARKGHTEQVVRLLQQDPDKAAVTDKYGRTCLHLACISGHLTTALAILQSGAVPIDSMTKRGHTSLHEACQEGHTHLSLLLLSLGASLHSRSRDGWTPLMCACSHGHQQLARIVISAGADVNAITRLGLTSLHIAAWKGHTAVVQLLLSSGSNPATVTHNNKTAQQLASEEEHHETVTVLQAAITKATQDPVYRISSLEGQLRLCQEKLAQALTHHDQALAAEHHRREERERKLLHEHAQQLEQARATITALQTLVTEQMQSEKRAATETTVTMNGKFSATEGEEERATREDSEEPLSSPRQNVGIVGLFNKSASYSDLSAPGSRASPVARQPLTTPTKPSSQRGERASITDMVAECMRNPASMTNIRSELKADNLTPKIQRKFHCKAPRMSLPAMNNETSPLARDSVRAGEAESQGSSPRTSRFKVLPSDI